MPPPCLPRSVAGNFKVWSHYCLAMGWRVLLTLLMGLNCLAVDSEKAISNQPGESPSAGTSTLKSKRKITNTVLFMGWENVNKGRMQPAIDPARVSENGQKVIAGLQNSWNVVFKTNGHGLEPYQIPQGIRLTIEKARKSAPWLLADQPWEETLHSLTVLPEKGRFRCWYSHKLSAQRQEYGFQNGRAIETSGTGMSYAESTDGIHWTKPNLGICTFNGSTNNNIVSFENFIATVFRDDQGLPEERYKSFAFGKLPPEELAKGGADFNSYGLYALVSPDGLHWKKLSKPLIRHFCDTQNVGAWDSELKKYVGYFRDHQGGRAISRAETDDFHNWPPPQPIMVPGPEDGVSDDIYSNGFTTYPGDPKRRLLFPAMYHQNTDQVDVRLALSQEGRSFNWVSHEPIIELGAPGGFDSKQIYASPNLIRLPDGQLALSYLGYATTHNEGFFPGFYKSFPTTGKIAWALWDDGRLMGIEAAATGEFYTQPFKFDGNQIELNARAANGGSILVELIQNGKPLEDFTRAESIPLQGNQLWSPLRWKDKADLAELRGKKLQLHVILNQAKIFGYRNVTSSPVTTPSTK